LLIWGARHENVGASCAAIANIEKNREQIVAEVRRRWRERDPIPFLPQFEADGVEHDLRRKRKG